MTKKISKNIIDDRFFKLINESDDGIVVVNRQGKILYSNPRTAQLFGNRARELQGNIFGLSFTQDKPVEIQIPRSSDDIIDVELRVSDTSWEGEDALLYNLRDITDRKETERSLMRSRELLKQKAEVGKVGAWEINVYNMAVYLSEQTKIMHEVPEDYQPAFQEAISFYKGDSRQKIRNALKNAMENGIDFDLELEFTTYRGKDLWVRATGKPKMAAGKCIRLSGTFQDITERKKSEIELRKSEERMKMVLQNVPVISWMVTVTDGIMKVDYISPNVEDIMGITRQDIADDIKNWFSIIHPEHQEETYSKFTQFLQGKTDWNIDYRIIKDGKERWLHSYGEFLEEKEQERKIVVGIVSDITDRKNWEKQILDKNSKIERQNEEYLTINEELNESLDRIKLINESLEKAKEKAEESDRLKSAFLANISHEIRTPMNGILGFASLLREPKLSKEKSEQYIGIIEKSGERMLTIINDLVDISRIEAGIVRINKGPFHLNNLLGEIVNFFAPEAEARGIKLFYQSCLTDKNDVVNSDRNKIQQVLINLVKNALKFTYKGSIKIGCKYEKDFMLYVEDTGVGIPEQKQQEVFERFSQVESSDGKLKEGTGLGLSIARSFVEMLGGEIGLKSTPGKGSVFYFSLPGSLTSGKKIRPKKKAEKSRNLYFQKPTNILIVEDDPFSRRYLMELLNSEKVTLHQSVNGKEAVELIQSTPSIDLVLMDLRMPIMSGFEAISHIKKQRPELPIIVQTAFTSAKEQQLARKVGCDDFISKPIDPDKLYQIIATHLSFSSTI
jgi:hypothetical protein